MTTYQKQHYEDMASFIKGLIIVSPLFSKEHIEILIMSWVRRYEGDNPRFNREKFIKACVTP